MDYVIQVVDTNPHTRYLMTNVAVPDQLAFSEANWSGCTLFAMARHIRGSAEPGLSFKFMLSGNNERLYAMKHNTDNSLLDQISRESLKYF